MEESIQAFVDKWTGSGAAERANKDAFLIELCDALEVPRPNPTTSDPTKNTYVFEKDAPMPHEGGVVTLGKMDLFKADCFILEAKQGSEAGAKKLGTATRGTPGWHIAMRDAYGQSLRYARTLEKPVPFLIACDIGHCFDLYAAFDGSRDYRPFPNALTSRIFLKDLATNEKHRDTLRKIFLNPRDLDPSTHAAAVTREVAGYLANLAKQLETSGHAQELVASFLMRCLFTMFAEDVNLLPDDAFANALENQWIPSPKSFPGGIESLWRTMNEGGHLFGVVGKILRFNGGLFASPTALPLDDHALRLLLMAAECNWADVEPAIFGTLLERALDPKERHRLGAHYTPRAYVERLVKPTIEEPLRQDWDVVQTQVRKLVAEAEEAKTEKAKSDKTRAAIDAVKAFHQKLCKTRVLDPACGSGNFLYVTLDLFKRLEGEVLAALESLGEKQTLLHLETVRVTPEQFHGIEIKPWAKEIAELVLWIGYLQWHFRMYGKNLPVPEPVLRDYKNIECRDAVLAYDSEELVLDDKGKPVTRWDGETMKKSPVTGEDVPDESAQVPIYRYVNPRKAEWPQADFIVGNPPFIGNKKMRAMLGDGYADALRAAYKEVPETADLVMYWWHVAGELLGRGHCRRFGLITTNSITQSQQRQVVAEVLKKPDVQITFAVPDHPWVESATGAAVRIAMSVLGRGDGIGSIATVESETETDEGYVNVTLATRRGRIQPDFRIGAAVASSQGILANRGLSFMGVTLVGHGFRLDRDDLASLKLDPEALPEVVRPYRSGKELTQTAIERWVIDFFERSEDEARTKYPMLYQHLADTVLPLRRENKRDAYRRNWFVFGEPRSNMRRALAGLSRYVATLETSKHRVFQFLPGNTLPDHSLFAIACDDARVLGVLSSRVHIVFALAAGSRLGVGNDSRWRNVACFDPFPFPVANDLQQQRLRNLGEALDAHRKARQAEHPDLTITGMYNVLEKLRAGEALTKKEQVIHEHGLVSVLKKIHDDLDAAVFDAYGWPSNLTDEQILERLVALNAERAAEERAGLIRWLRPDFQNAGASDKARPMTQGTLAGTDDDEAPAPTAAPTALTWPKKLAEQIAAVRELVTRTSDAWSADQVAAAFKGAKKTTIAELLDGLSALGLLVSYDLPEGRRWRTSKFVA